MRSPHGSTKAWRDVAPKSQKQRKGGPYTPFRDYRLVEYADGRCAVEALRVNRQARQSEWFVVTLLTSQEDVGTFTMPEPRNMDGPTARLTVIHRAYKWRPLRVMELNLHVGQVYQHFSYSTASRGQQEASLKPKLMRGTRGEPNCKRQPVRAKKVAEKPAPKLRVFAS